MASVNEYDKIMKKMISKYGGQSQAAQNVIQKAVSNFFINKQSAPGEPKSLKNSLLNLNALQSTNIQEMRSIPNIQTRSTSKPQAKYASTAANFYQHKSEKRTSPIIQDLAGRHMPFKQPYGRVEDDSETSQERKSVYFIDNETEGNEWAAIVKFDTLMYQNEQALKRKLKQQQKEKLRQELDRQVQEKQLRQDLDKQEQHSFKRLQETLTAQWHLETEAKRREQQLRLQDFQYQRQLQRKQHRSLKKLEQLSELQEQDGLRVQFVNELMAEQTSKQQRKASERDFLYRVMKEAEVEKQQKRQIEKEQSQIENAQLNKFGEILDQLETRRKNEQLARDQKISKFMTKSDSSTYLQQHKDRLKNEEERFKYYTELDEDNFEKQMVAKQKQKERMRKETVQILEQQINERQQRKQQEKIIDKLQGQHWKNDAERYLQEMADKKQSVWQTNKQHGELISQQISEKKHFGKPGLKMTTEELLQNKWKLRQIDQGGQTLVPIQKGIVHT